ncbi:hypothetical protein HCH_04138 [Hahella chejuensis KCTC 2396]|uniref:Uncharacterized protein n=1 Tax=Hahella chejuensis (strain KCTC 2396) TaxID=349521 RepID=Q2SES6_HAHCH|nr:hypothetical protein HCH_04138 [Hahella chejuensis KCTC 2396]
MIYTLLFVLFLIVTLAGNKPLCMYDSPVQQPNKAMGNILIRANFLILKMTRSYLLRPVHIPSQLTLRL